MINIKQNIILLILFSLCIMLSSCASGIGAVSSEEYFSLGEAYMAMERFDEAEKWFQRAQTSPKTKTAAQYNLGRIAFETSRYEESAEIFEKIIEQDAQNTMAIKAAAYARIKNGDFDIAENHYEELLKLVPESADDGYNYALVLLALGKTNEASNVISKYAFALEENDDLLLLYARVQKAEHKIEAVDNYDLWLKKNSDIQVQFEYAESLENAELYARAIEQYRAIINADLSNFPNLTKPQIRFSLARTLLVADPSVSDGITELQGAVADGFNDKDAVNSLLEMEGISAEHKEEIKTIIDGISDDETSVPEPVPEEEVIE